MKKGARFSSNKVYRYSLWRTWDSTRAMVMFVGLNPSAADEVCDDPTVAKCIKYARAWGYGGMYMTNLFAFRSTDNSAIRMAADPIGPENDRNLLDISRSAEVIVAAWGNEGSFLGRSNTVRSLFPCLHYLNLNKSGEPSHPLYLASNLRPILWSCNDV
jgi:hypothetical protein